MLRCVLDDFAVWLSFYRFQYQQLKFSWYRRETSEEKTKAFFELDRDLKLWKLTLSFIMQSAWQAYVWCIQMVKLPGNAEDKQLVVNQQSGIVKWNGRLSDEAINHLRILTMNLFLRAPSKNLASIINFRSNSAVVYLLSKSFCYELIGSQYESL